MLTLENNTLLSTTVFSNNCVHKTAQASLRKISVVKDGFKVKVKPPLPETSNSLNLLRYVHLKCNQPLEKMSFDMHNLPISLSMARLSMSSTLRWIFVWTMVIASCLQAVNAQPVKGSVYRDFLPMGSGASVALPEGRWEVTQFNSLDLSGDNWEVYTLKNQQVDAKVPFLVVRQTTHNRQNWGNTGCMSQNSHQFMVSEHGTLINQLTNKCSRAFAINFDSWRRLAWANPNDMKWWSGAAEGLPDKMPGSISGIFLLELTVQRLNGKKLRIEAFVLPPQGTTAFKFRDAFRAGQVLSEHQLLSGWTSIYIESMQQSFFDKKPQAIMALGYPVDAKAFSAPPASVTNSYSASALAEKEALDKAHEQRTQEVLREMQATTTPSNKPPSSAVSVSASVPSRPSPTTGSPGFTLPHGAVADTAAQLRLEQERKAIEEEKRKMAQQLEVMTQMLAKLQQENAAAAKARELEAAASKPPARPSEPVTYANRKALVIGNDNYMHVTKLRNAGADANAMAKSLEGVGYKVFKHLNLDEKRFKQAIRDFRQNLNGGDEVVFFFAGHGVQLGNANYLLPTDVQGDHEDQVKDDAILLQKIMDDLEEKKTKFTLAVIDACRDNPFKGKSRAIGGRGLAPTTAATGQMIMFSAGSGQQALDRLGHNDMDKNGLFTRVFIKEMSKPGLSVDRILRNVRTEVVQLARSVGHEQTPALYDQAIGEFFFKQ